jgi:hypothetical protein
LHPGNVGIHNRKSRDGIDAWGDVVSMTSIIANYTQKAFEEGRWSDRVRGLLGLAEGGYSVGFTYPVAEAMMFWSFITSPKRLVTTSLPQFFDAAGDRLQGKDNALDVLYTGFVALGDAYVTGSMVKAAVPSVSAKSSFGELMTAEEAARYNSYWENVGKGTVKGKYTEFQINEIINELQGDGFKNNPLRQAYEQEVTDLPDLKNSLVEQNLSAEAISEIMHQTRRNIGVEYKDVTPQPLRDYIYEINQNRYGDPLGPTYEYLIESGKTPEQITESACRPNADNNKLLSGFEEWLRRQ